MNPQESELDYVFGETLPATGTTLEVAPGVRWLRMGLPFALNHINLWLLEDVRETTDGSVEHGWTIVDCGIASDATRDAWESIFAQELRGLPVFRVIVTHCHPDHVGLSAWLCERWQAPLYMTVGEYGFARMMAAGLPGADGPSMLPYFQHHGLKDETMIAQLKGRQNYYPTLVPAVPESFIRLEESRPLLIGAHQWRVITGTGHSPEHAALYCAELNVLISGDMVLPRISTNTSVFAIEPESDAVGNFLDSIQKFSPLSEQIFARAGIGPALARKTFSRSAPAYCTAGRASCRPTGRSQSRLRHAAIGGRYCSHHVSARTGYASAHFCDG